MRKKKNTNDKLTRGVLLNKMNWDTEFHRKQDEHEIVNNGESKKKAENLSKYGTC